ncbi:MAG TPA: ABC transporter substrate-binding protein [Stellaceae bacterium]|nr:ABC transporter substrate-binding protein [Stellaceae bacterium]
MFPPSRIVCLTEETVETLYLLGEQDRIVGISGYVVRPPQARREKPRVSAFTSANIDKILALKPDLVLTFSDLQADIAADLIRRGLDVHAFNQRSVAGILDMIRMPVQWLMLARGPGNSYPPSKHVWPTPASARSGYQSGRGYSSRNETIR